MFFGQERILEMRRLILADNELETRSALKRLLEFQEDFYQMFQAVQDKPMIIRLLDPPMHEFLPKDSQEIKALADKPHKSPEKLTRRIEQLQESNPMLGHRGCRLGITQPEIYKMQVEAVFNSAISWVKKDWLSSQKSWFRWLLTGWVGLCQSLSHPTYQQAL